MLSCSLGVHGPPPLGGSPEPAGSAQLRTSKRVLGSSATACGLAAAGRAGLRPCSPREVLAYAKQLVITRVSLLVMRQQTLN